MRYQSAAAFDRSTPSVLRVGANRVVSASMYAIPYRLRVSVPSPGSGEALSRYKLDSEITSRTVAFNRVRTGAIGDPSFNLTTILCDAAASRPFTAMIKNNNAHSNARFKTEGMTILLEPKIE